VGDHIGPFAGPELVLIGPGLPHCWQIPEGTTEGPMVGVKVFHFHPAVLGSGWESRPELAGIRALLTEAAQGLTWSRAQVQALAPRLQKPQAPLPFEGLMAFFDLLHRLAQLPGRQLLSSPGFRLQGDDRAKGRVQRVHRFLLAHFREEINLERVADLLSLSPSAFSHFFRKHFAKSFTQYLNELRLGAAARLLLETDLPLSQIGYECGFHNLSHFNRQFKATYGQTPTAYRQQLGGATP
jgi:AraC-like DNA-binding protein